MAKWIEIDRPVFEKFLSTGKWQPVAREQWPKWVQSKQDFTEMWVTPVLDPPVGSTGSLSTDNLHAYIDAERVATKGKPFRYYRYYFARTKDGRVFQWSEPDKDVEYGHHRDERPAWLGSYRSMSTG
jgi:hypothetical protein